MRITITEEQARYLAEELARHVELSTGYFSFDLLDLLEVDGIEPEVKD